MRVSQSTGCGCLSDRVLWLTRGPVLVGGDPLGFRVGREGVNNTCGLVACAVRGVVEWVVCDCGWLWWGWEVFAGLPAFNAMGSSVSLMLRERLPTWEEGLTLGVWSITGLLTWDDISSPALSSDSVCS